MLSSDFPQFIVFCDEEPKTNIKIMTPEFFYRIGCSLEESDNRFGHESKSSLLNLDLQRLLCPQNTLCGTACGLAISVMPLILV